MGAEAISGRIHSKVQDCCSLASTLSIDLGIDGSKLGISQAQF